MFALDVVDIVTVQLAAVRAVVPVIITPFNFISVTCAPAGNPEPFNVTDEAVLFDVVIDVWAGI